jgi:hypothetical protein
MDDPQAARALALTETTLRELVVILDKRDTGATDYTLEAYRAAMDRAQRAFAELKEARSRGTLPPYQAVRD